MTAAGAGAGVRLGVAILGAGASRRMGRPKLLLPWGGTTVAGHLVRVWRELGAEQVAVVCAAGDEVLAAELERVGVREPDRLVNPAPERGMFSSVLCAADWAGWRAELTHGGVVLGDQPHVREETLRSLLEFCGEHPDRVCQPSHQGRGRHPVIMPEMHFRRLNGCGCETLREFLGSLPAGVLRCELEDAGLDLDLDRPEDYERALRSGLVR